MRVVLNNLALLCNQVKGKLGDQTSSCFQSNIVHLTLLPKYFASHHQQLLCLTAQKPLKLGLN